MNESNSFDGSDMQPQAAGLNGGDEFSNGDESFGGGSAAKRSAGGFLVLGLVIVIAGGSLFVMRKLSAGRNMASADIKIDYPIDANGSLMRNATDHMQVLHDLASIDSSVQVPLENIANKNPFHMDKVETIEAIPVLDDPETRRLAALKERMDNIQAEFNAFQLNSVLGGSVPIARISGEAVRIGQSIGEFFEVVAIHGRSVELSADGDIYTLFMD